MSDLLSTCCGATHDERFHFNNNYKEGMCVDCKERAFFEGEDDEEEN